MEGMSETPRAPNFLCILFALCVSAVLPGMSS